MINEPSAYAEHTTRLARELTAALVAESDDTTLAGRVAEIASRLTEAAAAPQDVTVDDPLVFRTVFGAGRGPVTSARNPIAPPVDVDFDGEQAVGLVTLGLQYQGPPNRVHGGIVALCFDDVLGAAAHVGGRVPAFTRELTITYDAATPLDTPLEFRAWIESESGRKRFMAGEVRAGGQVTARARGLWISPREPIEFPVL
ncbi:PaaI family thioesterase [Brevibacterium sp. 50QC2O2]|uniref:PaaI family thioesterase n=1 Tax=Brevibacterium sp. 50QC2O2 TaxID=2968459 RepID=UPI00211CD942|nr:PaaI family thioesterase [Brevibacterium sp. 50QC2O2]MCQ9388244.1 PaaI family thioesterase [Brevibacterium sp. 50QC2O2]